VSVPGRSGTVPAGLISHEPYWTACASAATVRSGVLKDGTDPRAGLPSSAGTTKLLHQPLDRQEGGEHRHGGLADRRP